MPKYRIEFQLDEVGVQALHRALYRDNPTGDLYKPNDELFGQVNELRMKHGIKPRLEALLRGCK